MVQMQIRLTARKGHSDDLIRALQAVSLPLQLGARGVRCFVYVEANAPEHVCYEEDWEAESALNERLSSAQVIPLLSVVETATEKPEFEFRFFDSVRGLDYIAEQRRRLEEAE